MGKYFLKYCGLWPVAKTDKNYGKYRSEIRKKSKRRCRTRKEENYRERERKQKNNLRDDGNETLKEKDRT